jgi:uncharacterized protein YndB with AHSA1/START domain
MANPTEGTHRMSIRRKMPAAREVVYEAWIDPQGIREWMCPGDVTSAEAVLDVRVGGSYRIVMKGKERDHVHTGVYQVVEPNAKLVFTWTEEGNDLASLVTVEFLRERLGRDRREAVFVPGSSRSTRRSGPITTQIGV